MDGIGVTSGWLPTHRSPDVALPAWDVPDANRPSVASVDPGLEVRTVDRQGDWANVQFSNGWTGWVDGRALRSIARTIPPAGLAAWVAPDASAAPVAQVDGGLSVELLESSGYWAHVEFANGWTAWVDGQALVSPGPVGIAPKARAVLRAPGRVTPLPGIGGALVVLGSVLPWISGGGESSNAWDIPAWLLMTRAPTTSTFKTGVVLLLPLLASVQYLTRRPSPRLAVTLLASIGTSFAVGAVLLVREVPGASVGTGVYITLLGAAVMTADFVVTSRSA